MREISLHLLDIAENSAAANAKNVSIIVKEDLVNDRLEAMVSDDGKGMPEEMVVLVTDPFVTSRTTRKVGLGIPLFKAAAEAACGSLVIESQPGRGTCLKVSFQRNHIDRMPLGDIASTFITLLVANPAVHWSFRYEAALPDHRGPIVFEFDDEPFKQVLAGIPLSEPEVLAYLRNEIAGSISQVQQEIPEDYLSSSEVKESKS